LQSAIILTFTNLSRYHPSGGYAPPQMTPEHVAKLKPGDRIYAIRVHDPLSPRPRSCRGEVVAQLPNGIVIRTDNPEDGPDGELYSWDDPRLFFARSMGLAKPGARPWLGTHSPRRGKH
jgi:hypothetical protein